MRIRDRIAVAEQERREAAAREQQRDEREHHSPRSIQGAIFIITVLLFPPCHVLVNLYVYNESCRSQQLKQLLCFSPLPHPPDWGSARATRGTRAPLTEVDSRYDIYHSCFSHSMLSTYITSPVEATFFVYSKANRRANVKPQIFPDKYFSDCAYLRMCKTVNSTAVNNYKVRKTVTWDRAKAILEGSFQFCEIVYSYV